MKISVFLVIVRWESFSLFENKMLESRSRICRKTAGELRGGSKGKAELIQTSLMAKLGFEMRLGIVFHDHHGFLISMAHKPLTE